IGLPKFMVSTLASGDTSGFVDISDIIMMPAVTDLSGLNRISRQILHNAAQAVLGMRTPLPVSPSEPRLPAVALTMFGVTTPCINQLQAALQADFECMVFHATGAGGRTMEKLMDEQVLHGVLDITTTEVCDLLFGGVLPATSERFQSLIRQGLPCVASLGATDMVNFWAPETIPARFSGRLFHRHNPNVTLMRITADEARQVGAWIGQRLACATGPLHLLIPEKGVSALDIEGGPFFDPEADAALFAAATETIEAAHNPRCHVERLPLHINDPEFARLAAQRFRGLLLARDAH
ncbi:Tm-1-like ATP-binding domain-containing protein, partial [Castellaniella sp.]|uniref:Tm-1-like ATP-binding domain-containing protein n=1 Tax=Castellaniella sp. TaxID=1955812 RepID=UPI003564DB02